MEKQSEKNTAVVYDVVIIGGGASGMMTALVSAERGKRVCIIEKNKTLGNKLSITGGGRCNITNAELDMRTFIKNYGTASEFLFSAFSQFYTRDAWEFFTSRDMELVIQENNRVFPKSEKSTDVTKFFVDRLQSLHVDIYTNTRVLDIIVTNDTITGIKTDKGIVTGKNYVLSTGGTSHPETGSTGDGFTWLSDIGHTIQSPTPSIVPLAVSDAWVHNLSGKELSDVKITFLCDGKKQFFKRGTVLLTHFGISGPLILNSASKVSELLGWGPVTASIDMFPDINRETLEKNILSIFDSNKNKLLKNVLPEIVHNGISSVVSELLGEIDYTTPVHSVSKTDRKKIVALLKNIPMTITGLLGYDKAVIADGGISLSEINTKTMQSLKYTNLYITGDLLHVNRPSGGFSLQLCWTTGYIVGNHI